MRTAHCITCTCTPYCTQDCDALVSGSTSIKQFPNETQVLADLTLFQLQSDPNTMANAQPITRAPVSCVLQCLMHMLHISGCRCIYIVNIITDYFDLLSCVACVKTFIILAVASCQSVVSIHCRPLTSRTSFCSCHFTLIVIHAHTLIARTVYAPTLLLLTLLLLLLLLFPHKYTTHTGVPNGFCDTRRTVKTRSGLGTRQWLRCCMPTPCVH
jgi:hypothetical protein